MTTHGSARVAVEQHHRPPRVLLIDSENFFGAISPRPRLLRARLTALLTAAGPVHHAVAAFATTSETGDPLASILAEHRVASLTVAPSPDAAEDALFAHARRVHDSLGRCCWLVASADHRLAALAGLGRIDVLAWEGQPVADRLTNVAHATHRFPRSDSATDAFPEPIPTPSSRQRRCPDVLRAAGYAVLSGIGVAIGQHLTVSVLGRRRR